MGYVEKVQGVHGLLRPGGRFVASITHPCTDTPSRVWERDGGGKKRWLCIDRYFERGPLEYTWSGWGREFTTEAIHATLEDSAGFRGCCKGALLSVFRLGASMDGLMEVLLKQGVSPCRSKHDCNSVLAIAKAAPDRYGLQYSSPPPGPPSVPITSLSPGAAFDRRTPEELRALPGVVAVIITRCPPQ